MISDISVLADKVKLEALELRGNEGLTDISALANLKELTQLNLDYNDIEDFSYLKDKTKMRDLSLWETGMTSLDFMSEMTELENLQIGRDPIGGDISVLSRMTKLKWINLCSLGIADISPLKDLKELEWVGLTGNFINDISGMAGWTKVSMLDLSANFVTDISVLSNMKELYNVELDENYISAFGVLDLLPKLEYINIDNNTPAPENGWFDMKGGMFWFENSKVQGTYNDPKGVLGDETVRGREIYDPVSDGWYWLDSVYCGAKAVNKEVWMPYIYQNEADWSEDEIRMNAEASGDMMEQVIREINDRTGKWVRYDENGKMYKGWYTVEGMDAKIYPDQVGNTYYYDHRTGLMAKGEVEIEGVVYYFDTITGVLQR